MEWLDEAQAVLGFFFWGSMAWAFLKVRAFRRSYPKGDPGYQLLSIIATLFGWIVALTALLLPRLVLNINREGDAFREVLSVVSTLVLGGLIWWTILAVRGIAAGEAETTPDAKSGPDGLP